MNRRMLRFATVVSASYIASMFIIACSLMGTLSFDQQLKLTADSATAVTQRVESAYKLGIVNQQQAENYLDLARSLRRAVEISIELKDTDVVGAQAQLQLANELLLRLQEYLIMREQEKDR